MALPSGTDPVVEQISIGGAIVMVGGASPHNSVQAPKGSLFIRNDTGASTVATRLYVNMTGSTTWTAITTVA